MSAMQFVWCELVTGEIDAALIIHARDPQGSMFAGYPKPQHT